MSGARRFVELGALALAAATGACILLLAPDVGGGGGGGPDTGGGPPPWPPGPRTLGGAVPYPVANLDLGLLVVADLSGDGRADVATLAPNGQRILVFYQTGAGTLGPPDTILAADLMLRGLAAGDLNGDGRTDLAVSGLSIAALSGYLGRAYVYLQLPGGTLAPPIVDTISANNLGDLAIGDVTGDGRRDLVVMTEWVVGPGDGRLSIRPQRLDGSQGPEVLYDHGSIVYTGEIHIADMNHDGRNDIVLQTGTDFAVILQTATGGLDPTPQTYTIPNTIGYRVFPIGVGDLNGDGWSDVLVPDQTYSGVMRVWWQSAGGTLVPADSIVLGGAPNRLAVADLDGNGEADVIGHVHGLVLVAFQTGHTFPQVSYFGAPSGNGGVGAGLAVADVTGDGWRDAVITSGLNGVAVLPAVLK